MMQVTNLLSASLRLVLLDNKMHKYVPLNIFMNKYFASIYFLWQVDCN